MALELAPVPVTFNVMSEPYETFVTALRGALAGANHATVEGPKSKIRRPVLAKETTTKEEPYKQPPRWIHVVLNVVEGKTIKASPKVAIRNDNAYILGFSNSNGEWFQLSKTGTKVNLVNDKVKMLGFGVNYGELVKDGINGLTVLNLNKISTAKAAGKLWNHTAKKLYDEESAMLGGNNDPSDDLKKAIATLCVVLSEAARFTPVSDVINNGWDKDDRVVSIRDKEVRYMKEWSDLSTQLLKWKEAGYENDKEFFKEFVNKNGIKDGEDALAKVQLVKQIIRKKKSLLAWLKYFLGLLVKKLQQEDAIVYEKPKGSAVVTPL